MQSPFGVDHEVSKMSPKSAGRQARVLANAARRKAQNSSKLRSSPAAKANFTPPGQREGLRTVPGMSTKKAGKGKLLAIGGGATAAGAGTGYGGYKYKNR